MWIQQSCRGPREDCQLQQHRHQQYQRPAYYCPQLSLRNPSMPFPRPSTCRSTPCARPFETIGNLITKRATTLRDACKRACIVTIVGLMDPIPTCPCWDYANTSMQRHNSLTPPTVEPNCYPLPLFIINILTVNALVATFVLIKRILMLQQLMVPAPLWRIGNCVERCDCRGDQPCHRIGVVPPPITFVPLRA